MQSKRLRTVSLLVGFVLLAGPFLVSPTAGWPQASAGDIVGTVIDSSGAVLPGVRCRMEPRLSTWPVWLTRGSHLPANLENLDQVPTKYLGLDPLMSQDINSPAAFSSCIPAAPHLWREALIPQC
jgi:hypothetical protein